MMQDTDKNRPRRASALGWRIITLTALLIYLGLATYQLRLPGLNYDEALDAAPAAQALLGARIDGAHTLELGGRQWPLMVLQWMGATTTYLLVAAFDLFGISASIIRLTGVLAGLISLLLTWGFLKEYLDERAASLSTLMLAVSPSFVFWSRMIASVHFPLLPIAIATIWLLFRWYSRRKGRYFVMAAFGLGFGLQTHIMFLLIWAGLVLAWLLLSPWLGSGIGLRRWLWPWQITGARIWILGAMTLLIGASPLLIYNLDQGGTIQYALERMASGEAAPFRRLESLPDAVEPFFRSLGVLLNGGWFASRFGGLHRNPLAPLALALAVALSVWLAARHRLSYSPRRVALFGILTLGGAFLRTLVEGNDGIQHLLVLWPLPQALMTVALLSLTDSLEGNPPLIRSLRRRPALGLGVLSLVTVCLVGADIWTSTGYHRTLARTGGVGFFSDAIYSLAEDLKQPGTPQPIALDWGFRRNLQVLTLNRVDPPEWFTYTTPPGPEFEGYLDELIRRFPDALYLFHAPSYTAFPGHQEVFEEFAYRRRLTPVLWKSYAQRNGAPVYQVYRLTPTTRLFETPDIEHPLNIRLGEGLAMLGYDMTRGRVRPGEDVKLTLYWKALAPQAQNYKVFAHLLDDNGNLWGQHDDRPVYGSYPMTEWQTGEIVPDRITIEPDPHIPPGTYRVFVGVYDESTGERLPLFLDGQRLKGDTLGLTEVTVESPPGGSG